MSGIQSLGGPANPYALKELKQDVSTAQAQKLIQKDGLDEIFVAGKDGKTYVAYAEQIKEIGHYKAGDEIELMTPDGRKIEGTVSFVDDEATSAAEGALKPFKDSVNWGWNLAGTIAGAGIGMNLGFGAGLSATIGGVGSAMALGAGAGLAVVGGGIAVFGALHGASNQADYSAIRSMTE